MREGTASGGDIGGDGVCKTRDSSDGFTIVNQSVQPSFRVKSAL